MRLGHAFDNFLIYATGGVAFDNVDTNFDCPSVCVDAATACYKISGTWVGWTAGAGAEYAFADNLSARLEYRYTDLGEKARYIPPPVVAISNNNHYTASQVMLGVTYHFH